MRAENNTECETLCDAIILHDATTSRLNESGKCTR